MIKFIKFFLFFCLLTTSVLAAEINVIKDIKAIIGETFTPKLRGLDAVATRRGMNPTTIRDTFLVKEWDDKPKLQVIDPEGNYAPVWAKKLDDGQRRN